MLTEAKQQIAGATEEGRRAVNWHAGLAQQFLTMVRKRACWRSWGHGWRQCLASGLRELVTFAVGLQREVVECSRGGRVAVQ